MNILFATAELDPIARVGGLAQAAAGLVAALRTSGEDVHLLLPDYFGTPLEGEVVGSVKVPGWAGKVTTRTGSVAGVGAITLVTVPGIARPNPYTDSDGAGWPDNDQRFFAFAAAVASIADGTRPDVLHLNDWHTALATGLLKTKIPTVLTIHTLGYQGVAGGEWLEVVNHPNAFEWYGSLNPLAGAIQLADKVIAVSPNYASEITNDPEGMGLDQLLAARGNDLVGILNGIDERVWDPSRDSDIAEAFSAADPSGKEAARAALLKEVGWEDTGVPVVGVVTRFVDQKGIDLLLATTPYAADVPFRIVLLGSGDRELEERAQAAADEFPHSVHFTGGYLAEFGHRIFAGSDLLAMPSRFEPCGLAQMQAMAYGTIPVVFGVGGLKDTVIDADRDRRNGTGFVATTNDVAGLVDALYRASRAWKNKARRTAMQRRGMSRDWSWTAPAQEHVELYRSIVNGS
jgi:starch synthase